MAIRIIHTHDTADNWDNLAKFVPKKGEFIIYDADDNYNYERIKIGDGKTMLSDLPFFSDKAIQTFFDINDDICFFDAGKVTDYTSGE